ncbi:MAG: hypothetical protein ACOCWH_03940, partial [Spirochaetota bacterium]
MFKRLSIGAKLITITAIIIIITAGCITVAAVMQASGALSKEAFSRLDAIHDEKHDVLLRLFEDMKQQTLVISQSTDVAHSIRDLILYHNEMNIQPDGPYDITGTGNNLTRSYEDIYRDVDRQLAKYSEVF